MIYWSDLSESDVEQSKKVAEDIIILIDQGRYENLLPYLSEKKIDFTGLHWINRDTLIDTLRAISKGKEFLNLELSGYRFDDFLQSYTENKIIEEVYRVFDNHSIIIHAIYQNRGEREDGLLVLRKMKDQWKVFGLYGFGVPFHSLSEHSGSEYKYRKEDFPAAGMIIPVPSDFSEKQNQENQVNFLLTGETERDAVFQVMIDEPKQKMYFYTYKLVEFNNQHYDMSELTVRYLPYGILFEYIVVDPYGTKNKGITVGFENKGKSVIIQFYSFLDVFQKREGEIEWVFSNIELY
jgi:hypothetical protein